jgi:hypothetical protein
MPLARHLSEPERRHEENGTSDAKPWRATCASIASSTCAGIRRRRTRTILRRIAGALPD